MKKLELKQMSKVNGGNCDGMERRFWRNFGTKRGIRIMERMMKKC